MPALQKPHASSAIGQSIDRVDGPAKVTGQATYAAEARIDNLVHAVLVQSTIARGRISSIDTSAAQTSTGVLAVITSRNMPKLSSRNIKSQAEKRLPLSDMNIHYAGQHIAVVVADTLERAQYAATLVKVVYDPQSPMLSLSDSEAKLEKPKEDQGEDIQYRRGSVETALGDAGLKVVHETYITPVQTHNPMEMSATIAKWEGADKLTVWDATQAVVKRKISLAAAFGLEEKNVRVISPFVGGAFGCKGAQWPHTLLAAAAAKVTGKPVKLMLTRAQMFTSCGHRPVTEQGMIIAAKSDGKIVALKHDTLMHNSDVGDHIEPCGNASSYVRYEAPAIALSHAIRLVNVASTTFMRAPGECPGTYALESAMDELSIALNMDPVQLRLANYAEKHPQTGLPWSTKHLKECYQVAGDKFGWSQRNPQPGSMRSSDGRLMGWGMATATYPARRFPNTARIRLMLDEKGELRAEGASATQDLGTGAYTVCTQITASLVGLSADKVKFLLGDTLLPPAGTSGGSATTAGVGQALSEAAIELRTALLKIADAENSPFKGLASEQVSFDGGYLVAADDSSRRVGIADLIKKSGKSYVEGASASSESGADNLDAKKKRFAFPSFGAHFVEWKVSDFIPQVRVTRVVSAVDVGRVINPKTHTSHIIGGVVMVIGLSLT